MTLTTRGKNGSVRESLRVYTNDPDRPQFNFMLEGTVKRFAVIDPRRVRLHGVSGEKITQLVTVMPEEGEAFKIVETSTTKTEDFRYAMTEIELDGKKAFQFLIENTRTMPGRYFDYITAITDKPEYFPIMIPVGGNIMPLETPPAHPEEAPN